MQNTVNRITASHSVLFLEKHPGFETPQYFKVEFPHWDKSLLPIGFAGILDQTEKSLTTAEQIAKRASLS